MKRRLEKKWMRILIICHIMLEGTEKFISLKLDCFKFSCLVLKEHFFQLLIDRGGLDNDH